MTFLDGQRLFEKIEGAQFGGFHRGLDGAVAGDDDHFRAVSEGNFLDARQRFQAIHAFEPNVQQHHFVVVAREFFQAFLAAFDGGAGIAFVFEHARQRLADAGFVVYDQNARGLHARASASAATVAGIST